jgi:hypothetical protein
VSKPGHDRLVQGWLTLFAASIILIGMSFSASRAEDALELHPRIDLPFECNDALGKSLLKGDPQILALGHALSSEALKYSIFLVGVYTADQTLSERCADLVRDVLVEQFGVRPEALVTVGYGEAPLTSDPAASENQRLVIVNMGPRPGVE